jgi:hypothetical protein
MEADPNRWIQYHQAKAANEIRPTSNNRIYNAFLNFTNKHQLGIPGVIKSSLAKMTNFLEKGNNRLLTASKELFESPHPSSDAINDGLTFLEHGKAHSLQDFAHILRNKDAGQILANHSHGQQFSTGLNKALSGHDITELFEDLALTNRDMYDKLIDKPGIKDAVDLARVNPTQSTRHVKTNALGNFGEITNDDFIRASYIEEIFTKDFIANNGKREHGLISAADELY